MNPLPTPLHSVSIVLRDRELHKDMSWFIPVLIGLLSICLVRRLIPRAKVDVKDKYVLITGCDSGFGRETAIKLDEMGVRVMATCLTKEGEQNLKSVTSDKLKTFQMDVTNSQQINDVYKEVEKSIPCDQGKMKHGLGYPWNISKASVNCFV